MPQSIPTINFPREKGSSNDITEYEEIRCCKRQSADTTDSINRPKMTKTIKLLIHMKKEICLLCLTNKREASIYFQGRGTY